MQGRLPKVTAHLIIRVVRDLNARRGVHKLRGETGWAGRGQVGLNAGEGGVDVWLWWVDGGGSSVECDE